MTKAKIQMTMGGVGARGDAESKE